MAREKRDKNKNDQTKGSKGPASRFFALILCCFFISGLTGLTYEILWTRMIVKINIRFQILFVIISFAKFYDSAIYVVSIVMLFI